MNFIVVDDNKTFREGLKYYLETILGHNVIAVAKDGGEFLTLDNLHEADIVLMDIQMPIVGGVEAAKKALWQYHHLKFIAVTSYSDQTSLTELVEAGFKACVLKSDLYGELQEAIKITIQGTGRRFPKRIRIKGDEKLNDNF